jgi:hypothetical protein
MTDNLESLSEKLGLTRSNEKFDEDITNYVFRLRKGITSGIWFNFKEFRFCKKDIDNVMAYIHEFTEFTIIMVFQKFKIKLYKKVKFKGFAETYIEHFISPFGADNGRCLEAETEENKVDW